MYTKINDPVVGVQLSLLRNTPARLKAASFVDGNSIICDALFMKMALLCVDSQYT